MVDNELARQMRDVTGVVPTFCDICGQPVDRALLTLLNGAPATTAPIEGLRACPDCTGRVERGEIDLIDDDDDAERGVDTLV